MNQTSLAKARLKRNGHKKNGSKMANVRKNIKLRKVKHKKKNAGLITVDINRLQNKIKKLKKQNEILSANIVEKRVTLDDAINTITTIIHKLLVYMLSSFQHIKIYICTKMKHTCIFTQRQHWYKKIK